MFTFPKNNLFSICYSSRKNVQVEKEEKNFMEALDYIGFFEKQK